VSVQAKGTALYAAYAIGAPAGSILYASHGLAAVGLATMLLPLATVGRAQVQQLQPGHAGRQLAV